MNGSWICATCRRRLLRESIRPSSPSPLHQTLAPTVLQGDSVRRIASSSRRTEAAHLEKEHRSKAASPLRFDASVDRDLLRHNDDRDPLSGPSYPRSSSRSDWPTRQTSASLKSQTNGGGVLPSATPPPPWLEPPDRRRRLSSSPSRVRHLGPSATALASNSKQDIVQDGVLAKDVLHFLVPQTDGQTESGGAGSDCPTEQDYHLGGRSLWISFLQALDTDRRRASTMLTASAARALATGWCMREPDIPSPSVVIENAARIKSTPALATLWKGCLWVILSDAHREAHQRSLLEIAEEVEKLWSFILRSQGECYVHDRGTIEQVHGTDDWLKFTLSEQMQQVRRWSSKQLGARLGYFFAYSMKSVFTKSPQETDILALTSMLLLEGQVDEPHFPQPAAEKAGDFVSFIKHLLPYTDVPENIPVYDNFLTPNGFSVGARERLGSSIIKAHQGAVTSLAAETGTIQDALEEDGRRLPLQPTSMAEIVGLFKKRIARALETRKVGRLEALWREAAASSGDIFTTPSNAAQSLLAHFMFAFMTLRRPNSAVMVWNHMLSQGLGPNLAHWDAMLKGCGNSGDLPAFKNLWSKMLASGQSPDAQIWATRITALFNCHESDAALQSFASMANKWSEFAKQSETGAKARSKAKAKAKAKANAPPRPNIQCLNALVKGLGRGRRHTNLLEALAWAKELDIKPDIFTYNALLQAAIRSGAFERTAKLLDEMRDSDIKPDVATFTLILDGILKYDLPPEIVAAVGSGDGEMQGNADLETPSLLQTRDMEQGDQAEAREREEKAIDSIFRLMERDALKPTALTFTTLVSGLLRAEPPNIYAAYSILQHLTARSMPFSSQFYSTLISFHFGQEPPDLTSVEALWHHARAQQRAVKPLILDNIFYDRLVGGWASVGHPEKALRAWDAAQRQDRVVGWDALSCLVEALVFDGAQGKAHEVIRSAFHEEETGRRNRGAGKFKHNFQALIRSLGLDESA